MSLIIDTTQKIVEFNAIHYPCRIGRKGAIRYQDGHEGDEKTPKGQYVMRFGLYRADRLPAPKSALNFRSLRKDDGWCDAADDPAYNRFIRLPYPASHERLWREDGAYDLIIVMSHNDTPPLSGLGSAVFIHVTQPDDRNTLGCVTLYPETWAKLLPHVYTDMPILIK